MADKNYFLHPGKHANDSCNPWEKQWKYSTMIEYNYIKDKSDDLKNKIRFVCVETNRDDDCARTACLAELTFVREVMAHFLETKAPLTQEFLHTEGFDPQSRCNTPTKIESEADDHDPIACVLKILDL